MPVLSRDYETRSCIDLPRVGAARYALDPSTEVLVCAFCVDDGPVQMWLPGDPVPPEFFAAAINTDWLISAHNDVFETAIEQYVLAPRYGWPLVPLNRHRCTMAAALAAGLPAELGALADALQLANRKDREGGALMQRMSKPRRARKGEDPAGIYWFEDPARAERLRAYCRQDTEVERELHYRLTPLTPAEQEIWELSCLINDRGFPVDRALAEAAQRITDAAVPEFDAELERITGGIVTRTSQTARLQTWLEGQGCKLPGLERAILEKHLEDDDVAPAIRRALELRLGASQAASKKIKTLLQRAGADDRIRGAFRYHGAGTGRWSGTGFQPQNLKKPVVEDLPAAIAAVATGDYGAVKHYPQPLAIVGDCSRSMIAAAPGNTLIGADYSSIESRALAWLAREDWKLDAYRRYDATKDPADEPYRVTAARLFHVTPEEVTDKQRASGKVCDLAFGFQGGNGAFKAFSTDFTEEQISQFKQDWRAAHPMVKKFWGDIDNAAISAVLDRSRAYQCGLISFKAIGGFLYMKLPSGRKISYPMPRTIQGEYGLRVVFSDNAHGFMPCKGGFGAYGGLWAENAASGTARDILAEAMLRLEAAGYPIVLHCHDEITAEVPVDFGTVAEFTELMTRSPSWAEGLPIAAEAWTGQRYTK